MHTLSTALGFYGLQYFSLIKVEDKYLRRLKLLTQVF